jgi:hypothetical protein
MSLENRDKALQKVNENNKSFSDSVVVHFIQNFKSGDEVTGEMIRDSYEKSKNKIEPKHPSAGGGTIGRLIGSKLLVDTKKVVHMTSKKSNGRKTSVYVVQ